MVNCIKDDLLASNCDYICHQVNCRGKMASGIAKSIRAKYPKVYDSYMSCFESSTDITAKAEQLLGSIQIVQVEDKKVINMFSQLNYGYDGLRHTNYEAFYTCLENIAGVVPKGATIGFPKNIGCGLGGGKWPIITAMIIEVLARDYNVVIYCLE